MRTIIGPDSWPKPKTLGWTIRTFPYFLYLFLNFSSKCLHFLPHFWTFGWARRPWLRCWSYLVPVFHGRGRGDSHQMDAVDVAAETWKSDSLISIPNYRRITHPLLKIHPSFKFGLLRLIWKPPIVIPKYKKRHILCLSIGLPCWGEPPPPPHFIYP